MSAEDTRAAVRAVIEPIVRGQVTACLDGHAGDRWPHYAVASLTKRIVGDLCSAQVIARIALALEGAGLGGARAPGRTVDGSLIGPSTSGPGASVSPRSSRAVAGAERPGRASGTSSTRRPPSDVNFGELDP